MEDEPVNPTQSSPTGPIAPVLEAGLNVIGADLPASKTLKSDSKESVDLYGTDKKRQERLKQVFHWAFVALLIVAAFVFILVFVVRALHFILPENTSANANVWPHCWLDQSQLQSIDKFFFSGALGALVSRYLGTAFPKKGSEPSED